MSLKKEIEEILHPPRAPIISEKSGVIVDSVALGRHEKTDQTDSRPIIDFSYLANNSSFQRSIIEFIKKFVPGFENVKPRGSKEEMAESFDQNAQNYSNVMKEFKEKLEKLK